MVQDARPAIVFHIGLERTGTTSLQRFCTTHARHLRARGLLYPTKSLAFAGDNHGPLVAAYLKDRPSRDHAIRSRGVAKGDLLRSLVGEIERQGAPLALLSSEHLSSRFEAGDVEALAEDFAGWPCKILVVLRDHRTRFFSAYATAVASGRTLTLEAFADEVLAPTNLYLRYRPLLRQWEQSFGRHGIIAVAYRPDGALIHALLARLAPAAGDLPSAQCFRDNGSLGPGCTEALRLANIALSAGRTAGSHGAWLRQRYCQMRIKRWLVAASATRRESWTLDPDRMKRLDAIAAEDAHWLAETYGLALAPQNTGPGASEPFADSPADATDILAAALRDRILGQWNVLDAALPAFAPLARMVERWRPRGA